MEKNIRSWVEYHHKQAFGEARFRPKHLTIDHSIALRVIAKETRLQGKTLDCYFVDFNKAFDIVPRSEFWKRMIPLECH